MSVCPERPAESLSLGLQAAHGAKRRPLAPRGQRHGRAKLVSAARRESGGAIQELLRFRLHIQTGILMRLVACDGGDALHEIEDAFRRSFYLRAVCQNRNLWGVEDFEEITIRHSKYAASRFAHEAAPALTRFANSSPIPFVNGIKAARERIVARTDDDRTEFLRKRGFGKSETAKIIETVLAEEGRKPESVFDFVQGITAVARDKPHQDARLDFEARAKKLLDRAA